MSTVVTIVLTAVVVGVLVAVIVQVQQARALRAITEAHRRELDHAVERLAMTAGERLDIHARSGAEHLQSRKELIDAELARMNQSLHQVTTALNRVESERAQQFAQVDTQLQTIARTHSELARTTGELREALSSAQTRGQWGERMVQDVLRAAGFVEGVNYRTQTTTRTGTRPDVTFLLPHDQVVHLDVKFPLDRYLAMVQTDSESDRAAHREAFLRAVRNRVRELSGRGYIDPQDGTIDCVLLFIPNEQVYGFVHEHDPNLLDEALAQKVVLCSPSTLFAVLAVIREAVDRVALERTSDEILTLLEGFRDQWGRFSDAMDKVGRGIETTQRAYDALSTTRRTQLERQLDRISELRDQRDAQTEPDRVAAVGRREGRAPHGQMGELRDQFDPDLQVG